MVERRSHLGVDGWVLIVAVDVAAAVGIAAVAAHAVLVGVQADAPALWVDVAVA